MSFNSSVTPKIGQALTCQECSLADLCLARTLSPDDLQQFELMVRGSPALGRGETLYRDGDDFKKLYVVKSGSYKTVVSASDGITQITGFYLPGELFGFDGFRDKHSCSAVALEYSRVCELSLSSIDKLVTKLPTLRWELDRQIAREITSDQSMLLLLARRTAEERIASFLLSISLRFSQRVFSGIEFRLSMSRHEIANYLGLAAETVSRIFRRFKEYGIALSNGRMITIQNYAVLEDWANIK